MGKVLLSLLMQSVRGMATSVQPLDINTLLGSSLTTTWPLVVTWAMDSDTDMIWDFTMALGGLAGYSYQAVPLYPHVSRSTSLHRAQTVLLLFLSHLSTLYLHFVVTHASHRHILGGVSECLPAYSSSDFKYLFNRKLPKEINLWPELNASW